MSMYAVDWDDYELVGDFVVYQVCDVEAKDNGFIVYYDDVYNVKVSKSWVEKYNCEIGDVFVIWQKDQGLPRYMSFRREQFEFLLREKCYD